MGNNKLPTQYLEALNGLTEEELRELNLHVVEKLKFFQKARQLRIMTQFNIGEWVSFTHNGRKIFGRITRLNRRSVSIHAEDHSKWTVAPVMLEKINQA